MIIGSEFLAITGCSERHFHAPNSEPARNQPGAADAEITKAMLALEREREQIDRTVWAKELLAEEYERVFVDLWDRLRIAEDAFEVLGNFTFGTLRLATPTNLREFENEIQTVDFATPLKEMRVDEWRSRLNDWKADGFRLVQSDWRLSRFEQSSGSNAVSRVALALNVANTNRQQRFVIRGSLGVTWRERKEPSGKPIPEMIDASDLELIVRRGEPMFEWNLSQGIAPQDNAVFIDPLILYDLNGDGLSEIVLACRNRVYWNLGAGKFQPAQLCGFPGKPINTAMIADFSTDGRADFLAADSAGLLLFQGDAEGRFNDQPKRVRFSEIELLNPFVMTAGDVDADGDLDLWLAQYKLPYLAGQMPTPYYDANDGFPSFLLINDGTGGFQDETEASGLAKKRFRRTYSSSFVDLDDDDDLDLVVVSDFAGADIYFNNGEGIFSEVTSRVLDESHAFGMAHTFGDYDLNGSLDFLMIGMNSHVAERLDALNLGSSRASVDPLIRSKMAYGNRLYFSRGLRLEQMEFGEQAAKSGWSWGATSFDFDNDGDLDIYVANGHKSRESVRDYETQFWRHDLDVATSDHDPVLDLYFRSVGTKLYGAGYSYGGYYKNRLFINRQGKSFLEAGFLAGCALEADCRNVVSDDLDGDGKPDLVVTTFEEWPQPRQGIHLFKNQSASGGNWIGFQFRESEKGLSPVGAKIRLVSPDGLQRKTLVTGDSYRSQHSNTAHFGLGTRTHVIRAEVRWPNGDAQTLLRPAINQYHWVLPE